MDIKEVKEISKLLPKFVMMCENELGEDEHKITGKPLTYDEVEKIQSLINKLSNCMNFVDMTIFE